MAAERSNPAPEFTAPSTLSGRLPQQTEPAMLDWSEQIDPLVSFLAGHHSLPTEFARPNTFNIHSSGAPPSPTTTRSIASMAYMPLRSPAKTDVIYESKVPRATPSLTIATSTNRSTTPSESHQSVNGVMLMEPDGPELAPGAEEVTQGSLPCLFWFLDCEAKYTPGDEEAWKSHCLSHFRGHVPPHSAECCLCDDAWEREDGFQCWNIKLDHIAKHYRRGTYDRRSRPDFKLFHYLWRENIISTDLYQDLKGGSGVNTPRGAAHAITNKPRTNERTRR